MASGKHLLLSLTVTLPLQTVDTHNQSCTAASTAVTSSTLSNLNNLTIPVDMGKPRHDIIGSFKENLVYQDASNLCIYNVNTQKYVSIIPLPMADSSLRWLVQERDDCLFMSQFKVIPPQADNENTYYTIHVLHVPTRSWTHIDTKLRIQSAAQDVNLLVSYRTIYLRGHVTFCGIDYNLPVPLFNSRLLAVQQKNCLTNVTVEFQ